MALNPPAILIVEDEGIVALDIQHHLDALGYTIAGIAARGEEAIRQARALRPDLVLMDIRLRGEMDGIAAAEVLQAELGTPVVYLTAFADEATLRRARITGPFGYLIKPFEARELHATIEMALYKHQTEQALRNYATELERKNRLLALTNRLVALSSQGVEPKFVLQAACCDLGDILHLPYALTLSLHVTDVTVTAYRIPQQELLWTCELVSLDVVTCKPLLERRQPVVIPGDRMGVQLPALRNALLELEATSLLLLPLVVNETVVGGVGLVAVAERSFSAADIRQAWDVIDHLSSVLTRMWLSEERQRLSAALEQTDSSVIITDPLGAIVYVNPAFARLTGFDRQRIRGQNLAALNDKSHDAAFYQEMWATVRAGKVWRGHIVNRKHDGSAYTAETTTIPVRGAAGSVINYVSVQRDVTRELELEAQYHRAQKMQAVGRLSAGLAHDFKNLLSAVNGFAQLIQKQMELDDKPEEWVHGIVLATDRANHLVDQLLTFSRERPQENQVLSLRRMMTGIRRVLEGVINEAITIETELAPDLWNIHADRAQLERVLINLVANARDAMPDGGTLKIEATNFVARAEDVAFDPEAQPGEYVRLAVSDTGSGMTADVQTHIFEPFFTTKPEGQGTGLGLATVHGIVKQSGGAIRVRSVPGFGTRFELLFPRFGWMNSAQRTLARDSLADSGYRGVDQDTFPTPPPPVVSLRL